MSCLGLDGKEEEEGEKKWNRRNCWGGECIHGHTYGHTFASQMDTRRYVKLFTPCNLYVACFISGLPLLISCAQTFSLEK